MPFDSYPKDRKPGAYQKNKTTNFIYKIKDK